MDNENNLFDLTLDHRQERPVNDKFSSDYNELKKAKNIWKNTVVDKYKNLIDE